MYSRFIYLLLLAFVLSSPVLANPNSLTIRQAYELTLKQSEDLKINSEGLINAEAEYREAISAVYPKIFARASHQLQDNDRNSSNNTFTSRNNQDRSRFRAGITITQPIFSGFRDFLLSAAAENEIKALKLDDLRSRELLYKEIADIFLQILYYEEDLKELSRTSKILKDRVEELTQFVSLGKSKESERLSAESEIADVEAAKASTIGLNNASKAVLSYLTGLPTNEMILKDDSTPLIKEGLDSYLLRGSERADLAASKTREISIQKQLTAAEREKWPEIGLEGSYYPLDAPSGDSSSSVMITIDLPLFEGGAIDARIDQQKAQQRITELRTQQLKRQIERDIKVAWENALSTEAQVRKLKELVAASQKSYEAQKSDYALGVVNNLEVLQSIRSLQEAKRKLLRAQFDLKSYQTDLLVHTGGIIQ